jgi:hypothetical protein
VVVFVAGLIATVVTAAVLIPAKRAASPELGLALKE